MKIRAEVSDGVIETSLQSGSTLLDHLREAGVFVNAACGGKGSCQKCRVQLKDGFLGITSADRKAFSEQELKGGWRLSCQSRPKTKCTVRVPETESFKAKARVIKGASAIDPRLPLVCDLGSTGVVVSALSSDKKVAVESHLLNRQVKFGSDVMTRLNVAQHQGVEPLQKALFETLNLMLQTMRNEISHLTNKVVYCSGNSAMVSFLQGWDISSLAVSPYQPPNRQATQVKNSLLNDFSELKDFKINTLPLLGGFVGADTFAGILYIEQQLGFQKPWMLVDIGTNTEIVLRDEHSKLWFCSAPAGPAFEGGNISQGMRAEPGAIAVANYDSGEWKVATIGNDVAKGVCGSGLIDILAEASKSELMTADGFLPEASLQITNDISILADDVREFQLAKSATRSACELLMQHADTRPEKIFLAGTFAQHLRLDSVEVVGLLPKGIPIEQIGNSSLYGTILWATMNDEERALHAQNTDHRIKQIELALQDEFQDIFVRNLNFGID